MTTTLEENKTETTTTPETPTPETPTPETTTPGPQTITPPKSYATYPGVFYLDPTTNKMERSYPTKLLEVKSYIAKSPIHGMGCFAKQDIQMGELIEECIAIITDTTTKSNTDFVINNYLFTWPCEFQDAICNEHGPTYFVPSGNSLIYNHSDTPNAYWIFDKAMKRIFMGALRDIKQGEEITWYYGHGYAHKLRTQNNPNAQKTEGCGTCAARRKQLEEMNRLKAEKSDGPVGSTETQFRSMVVPEKILNEQTTNNDIQEKNQDAIRRMIENKKKEYISENKLNDTPLT